MRQVFLISENCIELNRYNVVVRVFLDFAEAIKTHSGVDTFFFKRIELSEQTTAFSLAAKSFGRLQMLSSTCVVNEAVQRIAMIRNVISPRKYLENTIAWIWSIAKLNFP